MRRSRHLLLAVTAHGYGHLAQSAPVANELARRFPGLRVTLQGAIDPAFARARLLPGFAHVTESADIGLLSDGPLETDWERSLDAYDAFDSDYDRQLDRQMALLRELSPDLALSDVPWLPLDAAQRLGIPAIALCSLSWYDIWRESPLAERVPQALMERMRRIYAAADLFVRPAPSMPMAWLPNARDVGPIAWRAPDRRAELRIRLGLPGDMPLALVQLGGLGGPRPIAAWHRQRYAHWLVAGDVDRPRPDATALSSLGLGVQDVLGSVDLMLAKPGYGSFAEAACNGLRLLYVRRSDWPEEPALLDWLKGKTPMREIGRDALASGNLDDALSELMAEPPPIPVEPTGIVESADLLAPWLDSD
jgi:hypothetical protein